MKDYNDLQLAIDNVFKDYLFTLLRLDGQRLKYFYWSKDFFETVGFLSFKYFVLTNEHKDNINTIGDFYFDSGDSFFEINKNSHRHDMTIKNFNKLFTNYSSKVPQTNRFEYIKEFILWDILSNLPKDDIITSFVVEQQKKNFLSTYLIFLLEYFTKPNYQELTNYINYKNTKQGEDLLKKINALESTENVKNDELVNKINCLYIHKEDENKLHFVFSREGGEEKEELRELLDVMGREETGKLYRGQANSSWKLDSSLTREAKYINHEAEMYYEILSLKPDSFSNDNTVYERMITMQHFGMPTRLMDVTRNPLVAIFFACNNLERANVDGIVYTFKKENSDFLNFEDDKLKNLKILFDKSNGSIIDISKDEFLSKIWFIRGVAKNQRINSQSGDFIFVGTSDIIEKNLVDLPSLTIIIDSKTKKILLEQLESLNIHGGAVYPDLTHMSNYIRNKYLNDKSFLKNDFIKLGVEPTKKTIAKKLTEEEATALFNKTFNKKEKHKEVKILVNQFDKKTFWTKSRLSRLKAFAKKEKLKEDEFSELMNSYYEDDRLPARSDLAQQIMIIKPTLKTLESIVEPLSLRIKDFAKELKK
jgi:hypothetical protein